MIELRAAHGAVRLGRVGSGLDRPECVVATAAGDLYASDRRGGVAHIRPDGSQMLYLARSADVAGGLAPNGIALEPDGSFLIAHLGASAGGVFRLWRDGRLEPVVVEVDGVPLPPTNFVTRDRAGRLWITVSTRVRPRSADYRPGACSGFLVLADGSGPRIVADGLGYANECAVSPDGRWLYVNETFARRLSRFPIRRGGGLGRQEVVAEFGAGEFPDGLAFDSAGNVWIACVAGNKVLRVSLGGGVTTWIDAGMADQVSAVERAYMTGTMGFEHVSCADGSPLGQCSSIAFDGRGLKAAYLGSLLNDHVLCVSVPTAGAELPHWGYRS